MRPQTQQASSDQLGDLASIDRIIYQLNGGVRVDVTTTSGATRSLSFFINHGGNNTGHFDPSLLAPFLATAGVSVPKAEVQVEPPLPPGHRRARGRRFG